MRRVFVTGIGAISAIGTNVEENVANLKAGFSQLAPAKLLKTALDIPVAELALTNAELTQMAGIEPKETISRTLLFGLIAVKEAVASAKISGKDELIFINSCTGSGIEVIENIYQTPEQHIGSIPYFHSNEIPLQIIEALGISRCRQFNVSTACSSSANAIMLATRLIRNGKAERILVGGNDALSRFSLNGFNALEIASPTGCRPFDQQRDGVTLGEAGAYLVLESEEAAKGKDIYAEVSGYANVNEAYHPTSTTPDGEGAKTAITEALATAKLSASDIGYVNAHGTGTQVNDMSEALALSHTLGADTLVSSTKGYTGHTLAACGALEAVYSILAIREQMAWCNNRLQQPITEPALNLITTNQKADIEHVLSNSFGFGGNDTSLIFSKV